MENVTETDGEKMATVQTVHKNAEEFGVSPFVNMHTFQKDVGGWSQRNFGDQDPSNPLLGMIEEVGEICQNYIAGIGQGENHPPVTPNESVVALAAHIGKLAHHVLKVNQGIRGAKEEHIKNATSEIALICDSVMVVSHAAGIPVRINETVIGQDIFGPAIDPEKRTAELGDGVADVIVFAADFCARNGLDMEWNVNHTWSRPVDPETGKGGVRFRDWTTAKVDGGGHGKVVTATSGTGSIPTL